MNKTVFICSIIASTAVGLCIGLIGGAAYEKNKIGKELDEANAMVEFWKKRAERVKEEEMADEIATQYRKPESSTKPVRHESRDYTKYYSRKDLVATEEEEDDDTEVVAIDPNPNRNEPPRIVYQDEAMAPDSDCLELEYHIKDEALIDPNTPGQADLIDPTDAFVMVGNLLRVPDPTTLPNTVYIYCPARDQYYEIYIYDNYWDPPEGEDESPRIEKIKKKGRFDG